DDTQQDADHHQGDVVPAERDREATQQRGKFVHCASLSWPFPGCGESSLSRSSAPASIWYTMCQLTQARNSPLIRRRAKLICELLARSGISAKAGRLVWGNEPGVWYTRNHRRGPACWGAARGRYAAQNRADWRGHQPQGASLRSPQVGNSQYEYLR